MKFKIRAFMLPSAAAVVLASLTFIVTTFTAVSENPYSVYVDPEGRMRRSDTGGEVRYFGTNYTLPFAHAYRAMERLGVDRKEAIDRDVYHLSRMGINAFRLHLWDAELADSIGNLLENDHLDLLDYLIARLEDRGISVILTVQTNFGNGYPERDTDTGAFTYDYDKCDIHAIPAAISAQKRYVRGLVEHVNPYTGLSYADNRSIIALEVNNEPCHRTSPEQVTEYINDMVKAIRKGGWEKPVLYNVSHNMEMVQGYYDADIQGTTYQWYPIGLVSGHERKGNFLPYVDDYAIPFSNVRSFGDKAKIVYEFDPADMLQSYMFPAVARTFAREGFQWATQFAYDPIDMARFNTEYQTHYLNFAYTPQKAIGMKIATRVMENTPARADIPKYPADTIFGDVTVSYRRNLALLNSPEEYFYTSSVSVPPVAIDSLHHIAGYGSSPAVGYQGRGAYLLDRVQPGLWRLELLPDVLFSADPFEKPSLSREAAHIINARHPMRISLPELGDRFRYRSITHGNPFGGTAENATFSPRPGVYLLSADSAALASADPSAHMGAIRLDEYVAPPVSDVPLHVNHTPQPVAIAGTDLLLRAEAFGENAPDSLVVYPTDASFWRKDNKLYTMRPVAPYIYEAVIPASDLSGRDAFTYRISAMAPASAATFPGAHPGTPLDWDAQEGAYYTTALIPAGSPLVLLDGSKGTDGAEVSTIPDRWGRSSVSASKKSPMGNNTLKVSVTAGSDEVKTVITKYVGDIIAPIGNAIFPRAIALRTGAVENADSVTVSLVNRDGITFSASVPLQADTVTKINLDNLQLSPTLLLPAPYPVFLSREFMPDNYSEALETRDIEKLQLVFPGKSSDRATVAEIHGLWLE